MGSRQPFSTLRLRPVDTCTSHVKPRGDSIDERDVMQPLDELLHRIRWDKSFAKGAFALGYVDRVAGGERVVTFGAVRFDPQRPGMFSIEDEAGGVHHIPLHRVRTVYKDGAAIWRRP